MKKLCMLNLGCDGHSDFFQQIMECVKDQYELTHYADEADVIIVFTCGFVKVSETHMKFLNTLRFLYIVAKNAKIIVTGCGITMYDKKDLLEGGFISYVVKYEDEGVAEICNILNLEYKKEYYLANTPGKLDINITTGCAKPDRDGIYKPNYCSFCKLHYLPIKAKSNFTIKEICELVSRYKVKILSLSGLNTTIYGTDFGDRKPKLHLLIKEVSKIPSLKWIRVNCVASSGMYPELLKELEQNPKVVFVNYFFQSGSDKMLKTMNIGATVKLHENVLKHLSNIGTSSAVVVGHPEEDEDEFQKTINFIIKYNLWYIDVLGYINSFGTPSSRMEQLPDDQYNRHLLEINELVKALTEEFLNSLIGQSIKGYVDKVEKGREGNMITVIPLNSNYIVETLANSFEYEIGDEVSVIIISVKNYVTLEIIGKLME